MNTPVSVSFCEPEFGDFLYAPIAEGEHEVYLTVLSALSRLGLDPWIVAGVLSALPKAVAVERLAALITQLPGGSWTNADAYGVAHRLIGLLPRNSDGVAPAKPAGAARPSATIFICIALGIAAVIIVTHVSRSVQAVDADDTRRVTVDVPQTLPR
jgi:hypothetical protein